MKKYNVDKVPTCEKLAAVMLRCCGWLPGCCHADAGGEVIWGSVVVV